ncbi:MAG: hypothetical protein A2V99_08185 [Spirochaetes bacterium RBG_16_67_19]|nr:MAG: hypothetical protein A2V99_08185 [Spirochaetes bacterium RBG_16_67_19]
MSLKDRRRMPAGNHVAQIVDKRAAGGTLRSRIETIRYYERKGLLPPPARSRSGYRQFAAEAVDRLRFIRQAQHLGFSLKEVQELLSLRIDPKASCSEVRQRAQAKIGEIEERVRGLRRMRKALCSGG